MAFPARDQVFLVTRNLIEGGATPSVSLEGG
jgi:hypothetical protein